MKCKLPNTVTKNLQIDFASSQNQVIEELNMKNSLLNSEKDELNKLLLEQTQQLTGTGEFISNLHHGFI